jgi:predicted AAA+ superfamily ATPase
MIIHIYKPEEAKTIQCACLPAAGCAGGGAFRTKAIRQNHPCVRSVKEHSFREGFVSQQILSVIPETSEPFFYRTLAGAEIDLFLIQPDGSRWAIEVKRSLVPKPGRGFYNACIDLKPDKKLVVYPGSFEYPISNDVTVISLEHACNLLRE